MVNKVNKTKGFIDKKDFISFINSVYDLSLNDVSLNGEQVEIPKKIKKISFSVDLNLLAIEKAIANQSDLIIVHHGLFWKSPLPIKSILAKRIKKLLDNHIGVFAMHLPLDVHSVIGNNSVFVGMLDGFVTKDNLKISVRNKKGFGYLDSIRTYLGLSAELFASKSDFGSKIGLEKTFFKEAISEILKSQIRFFSNNNKQKINKFAFVSGNGGEFVDEAIDKGIDCYVTGEMRHTDYYLLKEAGIDLALCGHYNSETLGLKRLMSEINNVFGIKTDFIHDNSQFNRF